jgi:hypothetical protein
MAWILPVPAPSWSGLSQGGLTPACYAERQGEAAVAPEHLLYGVLQDLDDPYGAQLGRRGRKHLAQLGWSIGTANPAGALLQAHGIQPVQLRNELDRTP